MKQVSVLFACAIALAASVVGCAGDTTTESSDLGTVNVNLMIDNNDVDSVTFDVVCDAGFTLTGEFNVVDDQVPPIWATIMALPEGPCNIVLTAFDAQGAELCSGGKEFTVVANETVKVDVVLVCTGDGVELLGNAEIDGTFVFVDGNACPRLHFFNAVPINVPAEGSTATVLVSDREGDPITTLMTATGGSFADASALSTTYTCDNANGNQTLTVTVGNGEPECEQSKTFDVTCPGTPSCDGVICDDTGNECTTSECNPATGQCEISDLDGNVCGGGGVVELAVNGGFETGALNIDDDPANGWTLFCAGTNGVCEATMAEAASGLWSGNLLVEGGIGDAVIKNANIGIGTVAPNSPITISFDIKGATADGGVVFVEFFSELSGGGVSKAELLGGGPFFPTNDWQTFTFNTTTGPDVSGGVTLQLKSSCGAAATCLANAFFDNASVTVDSGGGEAGICSGGECLPAPECVVDADCPDTGNECTDAVCNAGTCETSDNTNSCDGGNGTCSAGVCEPNGGGGTELAVNGGFETGALNIDDDPANGWTLFCAGTNGVCEATMAEAASGLWSGNLLVEGGIGDAVIKNANIGIGTVAPNSAVTISFDVKGATADGGVVFVEFFSELSGGGVSKAELLGGGPFFPTNDWQTFTYNVTTGPDVSGGVTLQLKSSCGAAATCLANAFFDNASVIVP